MREYLWKKNVSIGIFFIVLEQVRAVECIWAAFSPEAAVPVQAAAVQMNWSLRALLSVYPLSKLYLLSYQQRDHIVSLLPDVEV